jgi:hypothetical protein
MALTRPYRWLKIGISLSLISLAVIYWADFFGARYKVNQNLLLIVAAAILVALIPWEWIQSLKAGPLEVAINRPQVKNVFNKIRLDDRVANDALRQFLANNSNAIEAIAGSRILWIDDRPEKIIGQRRLFRALRLEVVTATSTGQAIQLLVDNPDFDLIITDIQRLGQSHLLIEGYGNHKDADHYKDAEGFTWYRLHEGVNFIVGLHNVKAKGPLLDAVRNTTGLFVGEKGKKQFDDWLKPVREIPVIFFAAYKKRRLELFTRPARALLTNVDICNDLNPLLAKTVSRLSEVYSRKIEYPTAKPPTSPSSSTSTSAASGAEQP